MSFTSPISQELLAAKAEGLIPNLSVAQTAALVALLARSLGDVPATVAVAASRALTAADSGKVLECTAADLTLTVPAGLPATFGCRVIPNGTTSIARSGGALLNGAGTTLTRLDSANAVVEIIARISAADSYVVTGA